MSQFDERGMMFVYEFLLLKPPLAECLDGGEQYDRPAEDQPKSIPF